MVGLWNKLKLVFLEEGWEKKGPEEKGIETLKGAESWMNNALKFIGDEELLYRKNLSGDHSEDILKCLEEAKKNFEKFRRDYLGEIVLVVEPTVTKLCIMRGYKKRTRKALNRDEEKLFSYILEVLDNHVKACISNLKSCKYRLMEFEQIRGRVTMITILRKIIGPTIKQTEYMQKNLQELIKLIAKASKY